MLVKLYSKANCVFCLKAKQKLKEYNLSFIEVSLDDPQNRALLLEQAPNAKTAPQIFVDGELIGGYNQLVEWLDNGNANQGLLLG